jgi:hypothetical protein
MLIVDILEQCSLLEKIWFKVVHDMECEWCPSQNYVYICIEMQLDVSIWNAPFVSNFKR